MFDILKATVNRIGVVTDQFLAGSIVGAIVIGCFGYALSDDEGLEHHGVIFFYIAVALIFVGFFFYVYARLFAVSSEQELAFQEQGMSVIADHRRKTAERAEQRSRQASTTPTGYA